MATVTWVCNKDARIADNGSNLGAGTSDFNPIGYHSGYLYRTLLGFAASFSGMTSISSAILHCRTSTQHYIQFGGDPDISVRRLASSWSEGSSSGLSTSNAVHWGNQPAPTGSTRSQDITRSESTWFTIDITVIMQEALASGQFFGLRLFAPNEGSSSGDVTEIYSREQGSSDPYIVVTYASNTAPKTPIGMAPTGGVIATGGATPTFVFDHVDSEGDLLKNYDLQVSSDPNFVAALSWNVSAGVGGISGNHVSVVYAGSALNRTMTWYWRVRTRSNTGDANPSPWTPAQEFALNQLPTVTLDTPSAANVLCEIVKTAGPGGAVNPRMVIRWTFDDPDGQPQASYRVLVQNDSAGNPGSTAWDSNVQNSAGQATWVGADATRGNFYHVTVTCTDSAGESVVAGPRRTKAQWTVVEYRSGDLGGVTAWSALANSTGGTNAAVVTEYASSTTGGAIGTWFSSLANATIDKSGTPHNYFHWRVWLMAWNGAASPTFSAMTLTYSTSTGVPPDGWGLGSQYELDTSVKVYGTQSLKCSGNGTFQQAYQVVTVQKNTNYILSARVKSEGNSAARLQVVNTAGTVQLAATPIVGQTQDWTLLQSGVWNSGDTEQVIVRTRVDGAAGTYCWFDALKFEASSVVTSWVPGLVGAGLSVDAGGIKVDASPGAGATFRLQGSDGAQRSIVELGMTGLVFGGDTLLESPAANLLRLSDGAYRARRASASSEAFGAHEQASTTLRMMIRADGLMAWGPTSGGSMDTVLYRSAADTLKTDDAFLVGTGTRTNIRGVVAVAFMFTGTLPGTGVVDMNFFDAALATAQMRNPLPFEVVGLSIATSQLRTAGTLTAQAYNLTTVTGLSVPIDAANTSLAATWKVATGTADIAGGSLWRMRLTTAGFLPVANNVVVMAYLALFAE